ncbi:hypothetical protein K469DRAFT_693919 [Zopfia rhizophila CBS 207.26]|uniref:C2H2-type domain-containing protein n=1 Tax=Zopfia rhizophila CBS 207.26 TaxID=1314779 RepID=A0A6A6DMB6_9PEZI|nr:hypothetical protein K469DRAFT_693919 [Zopfia rhizophila CBS 207.26]
MSNAAQVQIYNSSQSSLTSSSQESNRKRKRNCDRVGITGDNDSDSGHDERKHKRAETDTAASDKRRRRLKCPYYVRRPEDHQRGCCKGKGFEDMSRLRTHIRLIHTKPLRCVRCWIDMATSEAYDEHLRSDQRCVKAPEPQDDRISIQRLENLTLHRLPFNKAKSESEKWRILYRILFPQDADVPCPYEEPGMSPVEERLFMQVLERKILDALGPAIVSRIQPQLSAMMRDTKKEARQLALAKSKADTPSTPNTTYPSTVKHALPTTAHTHQHQQEMSDHIPNAFSAHNHTSHEFMGSSNDIHVSESFDDAWSPTVHMHIQPPIQFQGDETLHLPDQVPNQAPILDLGGWRFDIEFSESP